jgi:structural maintenance of chromosomes protein 5
MVYNTERLVHKIIVDAACNGEKNSQYFLVTPKLLPDLEYHKNMRVLCIMNGTWQPDDWTVCIKEKLAKKLQSQ